MQEELLEQLVENTSHKDSFQIIVSDDTTHFTKKVQSSYSVEEE